MPEESNKTKILFWAQLPPPLHGASLRNKAIFESKIIRDQFELVYVPFNYSNSIEELGKFALKKLYLFIKLFIKLIWKSIKKDFDVVYFTYSFRKNGVLRDTLFVLLFRIFSIPIIFHFRNQGAKVLSLNNLMKKMISYSLKKGFFICLSKIATKDVEHFVDKRNLYIVNNGIQPVSLSYKKKENSNDDIKLFFISNLRHEKGVFTLLEVYKKLQTKVSRSLSLSIVGEEGDISYSELETYITQHKLHNIKLLGPLYGSSKYEIFSESDIFIFPSRNEVFPGVVLEAMQFALPIVATNVGAIPDIIKSHENGIICDVDNVNQIVSGVLKIIDNQEFSKKIGDKAQSDFYENYTLRSFEKNMLDTFVKIKNKI